MSRTRPLIRFVERAILDLGMSLAVFVVELQLRRRVRRR
jgi:hypothetical protein